MPSRSLWLARSGQGVAWPSRPRGQSSASTFLTPPTAATQPLKLSLDPIDATTPRVLGAYYSLALKDAPQSLETPERPRIARMASLTSLLPSAEDGFLPYYLLIVRLHPIALARPPPTFCPAQPLTIEYP